MIKSIKTIDEMKPIFSEYLEYMSRFFEIIHYDSWYKKALKNLQKYSTSDNRHIYVIKKSDSIIGFALVNKHFRFNTDGFAMAEFYIKTKYQKKGYGRKLAEHCFLQSAGDWEIAVSLKNKSAKMFWEIIVSSFTGGQFEIKKRTSFNGHGFIFDTAVESKGLRVK